MHLMRRPTETPASLRGGCVATIGAFDGLHIGHRRILERLLVVAARAGLPALVFSFEPTPKEYFSRGTPPARLMSFREKYAALDELGIDFFLCPRFDARLAGLEPDPFIDKLLVDLLGVKHVVVGDDFRFARQRTGHYAHLARGGVRHGFDVEEVASVIDAGQRVSSTVVRRALAASDFERVRRLLGRNYRMSGKVIHGKSLGRRLGMPTANIKLNRKLSPLQGIFAVRVAGVAPGPDGRDWRDGVASIGTRPAVGGTEPLLEVHIFDFDRDIYGARLQVEFCAKLRDEEDFPTLDDLKRQMFVDAEQARLLLARL
jgi:riboflavin kinase/FMN adenylyltransferase